MVPHELLNLAFASPFDPHMHCCEGVLAESGDILRSRGVSDDFLNRLLQQCNWNIDLREGCCSSQTKYDAVFGLALKSLEELSWCSNMNADDPLCMGGF